MLDQSSPNIWATMVGSRSAPLQACARLSQIGRRLWARGFGVRSGNAVGADQASVEQVPVGWRQIFLPGAGFGPGIPDGIVIPEDSRAWKIATQIAQDTHPNWNAPRMRNTYYGIALFGQKAHTRNVFQVYGPEVDPNDCSKLLVCWAPWKRKGVEVEGGTRTAVQLALNCDIPVFNLVDGDAALKALTALVLELAPNVLCQTCGEPEDGGFHSDDGDAPAEFYTCPQATVADGLAFHKYVARQ